MITETAKLIALLSKVRNPLPVVADRMGWRHDPYTVELRGGRRVELRPRVGDWFGFYEIMLRKDYTAAGQRLGEGATVIDVGANIGCFTLMAASRVGPGGRVLALEPEPATFRQLVRNIELIHLTNVVPLQLAVGGRCGSVRLHADPNALFSSIYDSVNGRAITGTECDVEMVTLEALMQRHGMNRCDYLKLDCEGAEHEIMAAMSPDVAARIDQITMEVHKVPGHDGETLRADLERLGYRRMGTSHLPFYARAQAA
jgi:FkbM family methyltransferase